MAGLNLDDLMADDEAKADSFDQVRIERAAKARFDVELQARRAEVDAVVTAEANA
ncbi:unannotated protein [freshwater metagenome]